MAGWFNTESVKDTNRAASGASLLNNVNYEIDADKLLRPLTKAVESRKRDEQLAIQQDNVRLNNLLKMSADKRAADKLKQDVLLGQTLLNIPTGQVEDTVKVPGVEGNKEAVLAMQDLNKKIDARNMSTEAEQVEASKKYTSLLDQYTNEPSVNSMVAPSLVNAMGKDTFSTKNVKGTQYQEYPTSEGNLLLDPNSIAGKLLHGDTYKEVLSEVPRQNKYTLEQAHQMALKESGIMKLKDLLPKEEVPELIPDTPAKQDKILRDMTKDEWKKKAYESISSNKDLTGSTKLLGIEKINDQADVLFGADPKQATISDTIRTKEYQNEQITLDAMKKQYPYLKGYTDLGAAKAEVKNREGKLNSNKSKKANIGDTLSGYTETSWYEFIDNFFKDDKEQASDAAAVAKKSGIKDSVINQALKASKDKDGYFNEDIFETYINELK